MSDPEHVPSPSTMSICDTVAVVIPAFNEESRIGRALDSVLRQTARPTEILVVDDGSTDGTARVVERYRGRGVRCLRQENRGLAAARNTGIRAVDARWIALLDADDEWLPRHLERFAECLRSHVDLQWYCAAFIRVIEGSHEAAVCTVGPLYNEGGLINDYFGAEIAHAFSRPSSMILTKDILVRAGLFDEAIAHHGEDLDMWIRVAVLAPVLGYSAEPGCLYWGRPGSITFERPVDVERFIKRIRTSEASIERLQAKPSSGARRLIRHWRTLAFRMSVKQGDLAALQGAVPWASPLQRAVYGVLRAQAFVAIARVAHRIAKWARRR